MYSSDGSDFLGAIREGASLEPAVPQQDVGKVLPGEGSVSAAVPASEDDDVERGPLVAEVAAQDGGEGLAEVANLLTVEAGQGGEDCEGHVDGTEGALWEERQPVMEGPGV